MPPDALWSTQNFTLRSKGLDKIPAVSPWITPNRNDSIRFVACGLFKNHSGVQHSGMIAGKVVGLQEQPDPTAALIADRIGLARACRLRQNQRRTATGRGDRDPAFVALIYVGTQRKPKCIAKEPYGRVIVGHQQGHTRQCGAAVAHSRIARASGRAMRATCSAIGSTDKGCNSAR